MARRIPILIALALWTSFTPDLRADETATRSRLSSVLNGSAFAAFSGQDESAARSALLSALSRAPAGITTDDWEYLKPGVIARAIESKSNDLNEYLENLIAKLSQDLSPYENPGLQNLRRSARHYVVVLENQRQRRGIEDSFVRAKATLGDALHRFEQTGSPGEFERMAAEVRWLERHEQATDFVRAAREDLSRPNLEVHLPTDLIRTLTSTRTEPETEAINRNSDGVQTVGSMEVRGQWHLEPTPATGGGLLYMRFQGEVRFAAFNTRRRIQFNNCGLSQVGAIALIGIDNQPAVTANLLGVNAATGVGNGRATVNQRLFRRPIGRLADRAIAKKTPEIEASLSREVSDTARTKLKTQLNDMTAKANTFVGDVFLARARRLGLTPRVLVSTTGAELGLNLTEDVECGLAAPGPSPIPALGGGFASLHRSLATDLVNSLYVHRKLPKRIDADIVQDLNEAIKKSLPVSPFNDAKRRDQDDVQLTVELDFPNPFRVAFGANVMSLTLHAKSLQLGDGPALPAHDLTLDYHVAIRRPGVIEFERIGDPRVTPRKPGRKAAPEVVAAVRDELFANLRPAFTLELAQLVKTRPMPLTLLGLTADQGWLVGTVGIPENGTAPVPSSQISQ